MYQGENYTVKIQCSVWLFAWLIIIFDFLFRFLSPLRNWRTMKAKKGQNVKISSNHLLISDDQRMSNNALPATNQWAQWMSGSKSPQTSLKKVINFSSLLKIHLRRQTMNFSFIILQLQKRDWNWKSNQNLSKWNVFQDSQVYWLIDFKWKYQDFSWSLRSIILITASA